MAPPLFETITAVLPVIVGGVGYAIHNERRLTKLETVEKSVKEKVDNIEEKVDKIYQIALEGALSKKSQEKDR